LALHVIEDRVVLLESLVDFGDLFFVGFEIKLLAQEFRLLLKGLDAIAKTLK
jgi:hypothetical protein